MTRAEKRMSHLMSVIIAQKRWIDEHGGDLAGYVQRYGSADQSDHYGDGGEAIYAADFGELQRLEKLQNKEATR